jgi:DNA polymerase-3 subunit delta'
MPLAQISAEIIPVQLLQRSLAKGRLSHAYLFTGDNQLLLEQIAEILAQTLICEQPQRDTGTGRAIDCCDQCPGCRRVREHLHPDVQWIRPESKSRIITIDQVREMMRTIYLKPHESKYKIVVMAAADRLNVQAANAFLKTLEEPPPHSVLILTSTDPERILETILSRCLRLNFSGEMLAAAQKSQPEWLNSFAELASASADGLFGRYRLLEVLLAELAQLKKRAETELTARSPLERYEDAEAKLREKWEDELSASVEAEYRRQRADCLLGLEWWLRDVWLQTLSLGQSLVRFPDLSGAAQRIARKLSPRQAMENLLSLEETQVLLTSNAQEALIFEVALLKLNL